MTLVNHDTGELIEPLDADAAERLSNKISLRLDAIADNYEAVVPMIREAIERGAPAALGYRSPGEYAADRFGGALTRLGVEFRQAVVRELTDLGMSTRAIAPVVGVNNATVHRDRARVADATPEAPESSAPASGREAKSEQDVPDDSGQTPEGGVSSNPLRPPVTGIDGKTYSRPAPLNADELRERRERAERQAAISRDAERIRNFLDGIYAAANLTANPDRDAILADLHDVDRQRFLRIEKGISWPTTLT